MKPLNSLLRGVLGAMALMLMSQTQATTIDVSSPKETIPPNIIVSANRPMMMLVTSKDHTLFSPIYTDFEDIDGDGTIDTTFLPTFKYYGYFDATMCYAYDSSAGQFNPNAFADVATATANGKTSTRYSCSNKSGRWSGNFLNWATMTRLDVIRKMLYGGKRSTDTASVTVLERANLSQDSHGFVKYYRGTDIADYTPFSTKAGAANSLVKTTGSNTGEYAGLSICNRSDANTPFGNPKIVLAKGNYKLWATVEGKACEWGVGSGATLVTGSGQLGPKLAAYYKDVDKGNGGIAHEVNRPSQATDGALGTSSELNARIAVCVAGLLDTRYCQSYGTNAKPFGLLQEFGMPGTGSSTARTEFGMISGSYDKNLTAGALRRNVGDLRDEINADTGVFCHSANSGCATLDDSRTVLGGSIKAMDNIVLFGREGGGTDYNGTSTRLPSEMTDGQFPAWGNPIGEMVVQALQYYAGLSSTNPPAPTTNDNGKNVPVATWRDPLGETGTVNAKRKELYGRAICRPLNLLALSSSALSFDQFDADPFKDLPNRGGKTLNQFTNTIGDLEDITGTLRSVAVTSGTLAEAEVISAGCSAKTVGSLSSVLGICPEAPTTAGTYKVAGATFYANTNRVRDTSSVTLPTDLPATALKVKTYAASLTGGAPIIRVPIPVRGTPSTLSGQSVFITPEALGVVSDRTGVRMPMSVLTFDAIAASGKGELPWGSFLVTWNNRTFGGDYDMDIAGYLRYDVVVNNATASGYDLKITTDILNVGMGSMGTYGYSVIGTNDDGRRLTHRHRTDVSDAVLLASGTRPIAAGYKCGETAYLADNNNNAGGACNVSSDNNTVRWSPNNATVAARGDYRQTNTYQMIGADDVTLKDPLWYAAKYGSFNSTDYTSGKLPVATWDNLQADGSLGADGTPDGYFLARRPDLLEQQLRRALEDLAKTANTAPVLPTRSFGGGDMSYRVSFDSATISGEVEAFVIGDDGKLSAKPKWTANEVLNSQVTSNVYLSRNIITNDGNTSSSGAAGRVFKWGDALGARYKAQMVKTLPYTAPNAEPINALSEANAQLTIDYIRGDISKEAIGLRQRSSKLLGPVVNATPFLQATPSAYYTEPNFPGYRKFVTDNASRRKLLWVAANDGMLHAFNAETGHEDFAYVPGALANRLVEIPLRRGTNVPRTQLTVNNAATNFTQATTETTPTGTVWAYVDASPYAGDVYVTKSGDTKEWRTYVFGSLGRGGRAVYALDATSPSDLAAAESNAAAVFKWEFTSNDDPDLGYLVNDNPINVNSNQPNPIVKLNNGEFALMINNGVKSSNGRAVLFLLYLKGPDPQTASWTGRYKAIVADASGNNGLAPPTWVDLDKNGTADVAYAGDLKGNMWKFDLTSTNPSNWDVAYKTNSVNKPLFIATAKKTVNGVATDVRLPITTAPEYAYPAFDGLIITFGTGNAFEKGDFPNTDVQQRFFGIWDRPAYTSATTSNSAMALSTRLVPRVYTALSDGTGRLVVSDSPAGINWVDNDGWYFSLPRASEMVLSDPSLNGGFLTFTTVRQKTTTDDCSNEPLSSLFMIDPVSGKAERNALGYATVGDQRVLVSGVGIPDQKVSVVSRRAPTPAPSCTEGDPGCKCTGTGADKKCVSPLPPNSNCLQIQGNSPDGLSACYSANPRTNWREIPGLRTDR